MSLERPEQDLDLNLKIKEALAPVIAAVALAVNRASAFLMKDYIEPTDPFQFEGECLREKVPVKEGYEYSRVGDIMRRTTFRSNITTRDTIIRFEDLLREISNDYDDIFFYYDSVGRTLLRVEMPEELKVLRAEKGKEVEFKKKLQYWHNKNRKNISPKDNFCPENFDELGYPFVAASTPIYDKENGAKKNHVSVAVESINKKVEFKGEQVTLFDAIVEIAGAYEIPKSTVVGVFAVDNSSFKLNSKSFEKAKRYAYTNPDISKSFRSKPIGTFEDSKNDPVLLAEMFCAYFAYLKVTLRELAEALENRIRKIDPTYFVGSLRDLTVLNVYSSGIDVIRNAIERFIALSDDEIKEIIVGDELGNDVWLAMLAHSFGLKDHGIESRIGLNTYLYAQKVEEFGKLAIAQRGLQRDEVYSELDDHYLVQDNNSKKLATGLSGAVSITAGLFIAHQVACEVKERSVSRRSFLWGTVAIAATTLPLTEVVKGLDE